MIRKIIGGLLLATITLMPTNTNASTNDLTAGVTSEIVNIWNTEEEVSVVEEVVEIVTDSPQYIQIESTAFCDQVLCDGTNPHYGVLAGKREWLGKSVELYDMDYNYMGCFTFHDVGYGRSVGYGSSKLLKGKCLGNIETGDCIDIWLPTESKCNAYGRQDVYMVWTD